VRLAPFGEDFYVLRAKAENADLLGARLVAIDGHPIEELRAAARTLSGGRKLGATATPATSSRARNSCMPSVQ